MAKKAEGILSCIRSVASDYFPLHGVDEAALGVLCTLLGSPVQ